MTGVVLDASVLIAVMQPGDAHHEQAKRIIRLHAPTSVLLAHRVTLAESAVGAARGGHLDALRHAYTRLGLRVTPSDEDEPWRVAALRAHSGLTLPDCFVLDAAAITESALATFDHDLASRARSAGVVVVGDVP